MITRNDDGVPLYRAALSDITKRKQAEEKEIELQDQLEQAQKMESVGRLAGNVAHDFNNMLGVILGYVEMALEQVDPIQKETLHSDLSEIKRVTVLSSDLTRQLMAVALKQPIGSPKILILNEIVDDMLKMLKQIIGTENELAWMPGKGLWSVRMDPSQIKQMVVNLCVNARDAIGTTGRISIETGISTFDAAHCSNHPGFIIGEYVNLAVRDSGCGMNKETMSRIFKPFFTTKAPGQGSGLGLTMVSNTVRQFNGFIIVKSELGQGSTFAIYLPRHKEKSIDG
jgi:signal transduction histidine kinase